MAIMAAHSIPTVVPGQAFDRAAMRRPILLDTWLSAVPVQS
jgi:hypothetical protein